MAASGYGRRFGPSRSDNAGEYVPLLGKQCLDPVDYRAHAGGAAQIAVDDNPVFGRDFELCLHSNHDFSLNMYTE
jgi:hypothetical protein